MSLLTRTDVTAIKLCKNSILASIGSFLHIFDRVSTKLLQRLQVLNSQKVYGFVISQCEQKLLVFGGKQYTVLRLENVGYSTKWSRLFEPVICDDRLNSAVWLKENSVAVLTAHNVVQKWNISTQSLISQHASKENSILYSGLLVPVGDDLVVLAGTVFSEVIIHQCGANDSMHVLKGHRGVIFCISCDPQKEIIVTTSDDRSVRIWHMKNPGNPCDSITFWKNITIECRHEVYGHSARVMRSLIVNDLVISGGEDAGICFWREGNLVKKVVAHQTAPVWSMDGDGKYLVTGGGDAGINLHPLSVACYYGDKETLKIEGNPKLVAFTARKNLVVLNDVESELVYYNVEAQFNIVHKLLHKSTYKMLAISSCKQLIAVADMEGVLNVFIEICKGPSCIQNVIDTKLEVGKIRSMHWAGNRHLVLCAENGAVTVLAAKGNETEVYAEFVLPPCKERWLTSCTTDPSNNIIVVADRCSGIHFFLKGQKDPVKTFKKAHGNYGSTSLTIRGDELVSTGRDGTIKYYSINKQEYRDSKYLSTKELEFQWVEKFLDRNERLICGFHSKTFIVYDTKTIMKIVEIDCGGGHRSYDVIRYFKMVNEELEEFVRLTFIKNSLVYLISFQLSKITSKPIISGSHSKEINCLKTFRPFEDNFLSYYISGGEDTTLRVSMLNTELEFKDVFVYKHLSNVRAIKAFPVNNNNLCVISAGGRAQICVNLLKFEHSDDKTDVKSQKLADFLVKGPESARKGNKTWRDQDIDFDPETRIMDLDAIELDENRFLIFAGCSDGLLRIFSLHFNAKNTEFVLVKEYKHLEICILKTVCIKYFEKNFVVTCTTRGHITIWNVINEENVLVIKPIFTFIAHNAGINSFDYKIIKDNILIATGGDDNRLSMNFLKIKAKDLNYYVVQKIDDWKSDGFHCSQITGIVIFDDLLVSTSIDQRITINKWKVENDKIKCEFVKQMCSDIADIQGMELLEKETDSFTVCVFGKGLEVVRVNIP